jgi:hypothetical protein
MVLIVLNWVVGRYADFERCTAVVTTGNHVGVVVVG